MRSSASDRPPACSARTLPLRLGFSTPQARRWRWPRSKRGGGTIATIGWLAFCAHLAWQTAKVEGADPATALKLFRYLNRDAGLILFSGCAIQGWLG